jgi:hypothetical protein
MNKTARQTTLPQSRIDVIAQDRHGNSVLIVEVKIDKAGAEAKAQLREYLAATKPSVPFAMLVDDKYIRLFKWNGRNISKELVRLNTPEILSKYDARFQTKQIFESYFVALIEAWLRDLAYNWKNERPPGVKQMAATGLVDRLARGTTRRETSLGAALY